MSMVKSVLLLLKMEAKEDMSAANMTASMSPRSPVRGAVRLGEGAPGGRGLWVFPARHLCPPALTVGHELHDQPRISNVGAAYFRATHAFTHLGHYASHLVCQKEATVWLGPGLVWEPDSLRWEVKILVDG